MKMASRLLAALAAVAMLLVGGCAVHSPRVAATVGSVTITDAEVDAIAKVVADVSEGQTTAGEQRATVLIVMIRNAMLRQAAQEKGVVVSDVEREATFTAQPFYASLRDNPVTTRFVTDYVDSMIIHTLIGNEAFLTVAQGSAVTVNPRYGTWNQNLATLNGDSGSLSRPAPNASAATE